MIRTSEDFCEIKPGSSRVLLLVNMAIQGKFAPANAKLLNQACRLASTDANAPGTVFPAPSAQSDRTGSVRIHTSGDNCRGEFLSACGYQCEGDGPVPRASDGRVRKALNGVQNPRSGR